MELVFEPLEEEEAGGFVVVAIENDRSGSGRQQRATPDSDDGKDRAASWR